MYSGNVGGVGGRPGIEYAYGSPGNRGSGANGGAGGQGTPPGQGS
jgi:hypothetical protein